MRAGSQHPRLGWVGSVLFGLVLCSGEASGASWSPLRVHVECQRSGRSDACQSINSLLQEQDVVTLVPRSDAQVVLYVNVTEQANDDMVFLRAVGEVPGAPDSFEQIHPLDSRASIDDRRAALEQPVLRSLAPYVAAIVPGAVAVEFSPPAEATLEEAPGRPWGLSMWLGGWGSWTEDYQDFSVWDGVSVYYLTNYGRALLSVWHDRYLEWQPPLLIDGEEVSLNSDTQSIGGSLGGATNLNPHWSVGGVTRGGHDDPEGQFLGTYKAHAGVEYDLFPSDDPRGNRFAVAWLGGVQADWYNQINSIGQTEAFFPTHMLLVEGTLQRDTVEVSLELGAQGELLHPLRRYGLGADLDLDLTLGDHVDFGFSLGVTQQAIPGPGEVDNTDYESITRASYAEPLQVNGHFNLRIHFDNSNGARNNRFQAGMNLDALSNL